MNLLITGVCGFVGSALAQELKQRLENLAILGLDNLSRAGSELNRQRLKRKGIRILHGDLRNASDLDALPKVDWVIDAAANPSVLAGVSAATSSRQLMEHNLGGTLHLLEYCKQHGAGLLMLSTSRVYSIQKLAALPVEAKAGAFVPRFDECSEAGLSRAGVAEAFTTQPPLSLYGAAKLASEIVALEYGAAFGFPVLINRCGVLAGAGQFGKADQGIFSYWIHSYCQRRPLRYIGFDGAGHQVRDCLHPRDLAALVALQFARTGKASEVLNVGGGAEGAVSLAQLTHWCRARFGALEVGSEPACRPYDVPWLVLDCSRAMAQWGWGPTMNSEAIFEEIARHAQDHPEWLELSNDA